MARLAPELLPDKDTPIVTYCSNAACQNSQVAAAQLRAMGYTNVRKYTEGKQDWLATSRAKRPCSFLPGVVHTVQDWLATGLPVERSARAA